MKAKHLCVPLLMCAGVILWPAAAQAGGGGGGGGACAGFASGPLLLLRDSCFNGAAQFVEAGATLTVRNDGVLPHEFKAADDSFDTGVLQPGQTAVVRLGRAGIVPVYCPLHGTPDGQGMAGVLLVGKLGPESAAGNGPASVALGGLGVLLGAAAVGIAVKR